MRADVNIIDFDNLNVRLPEMVNDLPAASKPFLVSTRSR